MGIVYFDRKLMPSRPGAPGVACVQVKGDPARNRPGFVLPTAIATSSVVGPANFTRATTAEACIKPIDHVVCPAEISSLEVDVRFVTFLSEQGTVPFRVVETEVPLDRRNRHVGINQYRSFVFIRLV